jgi:hypothetical protein
MLLLTWKLTSKKSPTPMLPVSWAWTLILLASLSVALKPPGIQSLQFSREALGT